MDERTFEQIKNIEMAHEAWKKLGESFESTQAVKGAKAYILKEKFSSFKMKEDESVLDMFHRMEVLVNDLKALGEKVEDKDFSHKLFGTQMAFFSHKFLVDKSDMFTTFKSFVKGIHNEFETTIKRVRSDNGSEFKNTRIDELCDEFGIRHQFSTKYTP